MATDGESTFVQAVPGVQPQTTTASRKTFNLVALCALILMAIAVRYQGYHDRAIWRDEASTWRDVTTHSFSDMLRWKQSHAHPPLNYMMVKGVEQTFGLYPEWKLRLPDMIFGVLCVPAAFILGRRFLGTVGGFMLAGLVPFHPLFIYHSQQARMHIVHGFLTFGVMAIAMDLYASRRINVWRDAALGLLLGLMIWASQGAWIMVGSLILVWVLLFAWVLKTGGSESITWRRMLQSLAIIGGIFALSCIMFLFRDKVPNAPRYSDGEAISMVRDASNAFLSIYYKKWITVILAICSVAGVLLIFRRYPGKSVLMGTVLVVNILAVAALLTTHHTVGERYFFSSAVILVMGQVAFCVWLDNHFTKWIGHAAYGVILLLTVASFWTFNPNFSHTESEGIRVARVMVQPDDLVIYVPGWRAWQPMYYGLPEGPMLSDDDGPKIMPLIRVGQNEGRHVWLYVVSSSLKDEDYTCYHQALERLNTERGLPADQLPDMPRRDSSSPYLVEIEPGRLTVHRMLQSIYDKKGKSIATAH